MERKKTNTEVNEVTFKVYFIICTEIRKIEPIKFHMDKKGFSHFVCEKVFPQINKKFEVKIFSSTFNNNIKDKEIIIYYTSFNNSDKYTLNMSDNYLFNVLFKFNHLKGLYSNFPTQQTLSQKIQYKYYLDFLKENKSTYKIINLSRDIIKEMNNCKIIEFSLFLDVFKEVYKLDIVKNLLVLFRKDKIYIQDKIELTCYKEIMEFALKNINEILYVIIDNKKIKYGKKLYLFIMYYYYNVFPQNFLIILEERKKKYKDKNDEFEIDIVDLFFENEIMFKQKDDSNIINMFKYIDSYNQLICLLNKISNFSNWIKAIENNKERIITLLISQKAFLKIEDCSSEPEINKLDEIFDNIFKIIEYSKINQYEILKVPIFFYENIMTSFGVNLENLSKLKTIFKEMTNVSEKIIEEIEEKEQHIIYENTIKDKKLMNVEMLDNLSKDPYYQKTQGNSQIDKFKNSKFILNHISFEQLKIKGKEEIYKFEELFKKINFQHIFTPQLYNELNIGLLEKIKQFDDFNFIYIFINFSLINLEMLNIVYEKFIKLLNDCKGENSNIESYTLKYVISNLKIGNQDLVSELIDEINKVVIKKRCKYIMGKIIELINNERNNKNNKKLNIQNPEKLINTILKYYENDLSDANLEIIKIFLNRKINYKSLIFFFKNCNPLIINEDDFFSENESENFKIFYYLKENDFLNNEYLQNIEYIKRSKSICNEILKNLNNLNIINNHCIIIYKLKNEFKERIIKISNQEYGEEIYNKIINQIEKKITLKKIKKFIKTFYPTCPNKNELLNLLKDLNKIKLSEYQTKEKDIKKYINLYYNLTNKFYKFKNSNFFKAILKQSQEDNIKKKLNDTEESFQTLKNLLDEKKFLEIDNKLLNIIIETTRDKIVLQNDFKFLKKYFNIEKDTEKIETRIIILSLQNRIKKSLKGIQLFFKELNIEKGEFSNKLSEILRIVNDKVEINQLSELIDFLKKKKLILWEKILI